MDKTGKNVTIGVEHANGSTVVKSSTLEPWVVLFKKYIIRVYCLAFSHQIFEYYFFLILSRGLAGVWLSQAN